MESTSRSREAVGPRLPPPTGLPSNSPIAAAALTLIFYLLLMPFDPFMGWFFGVAFVLGLVGLILITIGNSAFIPITRPARPL